MNKIHSVFSTGVLCIAALLATSTASARLEYSSNTLMMKNSEEMGVLVDKKIKKAQSYQKSQKLDLDHGITAEPEAIDALVDALRIILARPDHSDGIRGDLFSEVRHELQDLNSFDIAIERLSKEAIGALRGEGNTDAQTSYIYVENNLLEELAPELKSNPALKKVAEEIRDAKIKISDKAKNLAFLHSMSVPISPSETASRVLKEAEKAEKAEAKKK